LDPLENDIRAVIKAGVVRGHVQVHVSFNRTVAADVGALNRSLLDAYMRAFSEAAAAYPLDCRPDLNAALRIPGMLTGAADEELAENVRAAILDVTACAVATLNTFREREGAVTAAELRQRCQNIDGLVTRMEEIRAGAVPAFHKRLREKLYDLLH